MLAKLLRLSGLTSPDAVVEFLMAGLAVLPALLFACGERNAAAVVVLLLINSLLVFGIRAREIEELEERKTRLPGKPTNESPSRQHPHDQ